MNNFQRFLSVAVIGCFFLPWIELDSSVSQMKEGLNQMMEMLGELAGESGEYKEAKAQMDLMNKMDGASGYDLATTRFGEIGGHLILFMVPALALFAAVANKKKGYIIYPILCGFCIFVNATYTGPIETGAGLLLTYGSLGIAFVVGCVMPKDATDEDATEEERTDEETEASDSSETSFGSDKGADTEKDDSGEKDSDESSDGADGEEDGNSPTN
jgi:hypothetical protein